MQCTKIEALGCATGTVVGVSEKNGRFVCCVNSVFSDEHRRCERGFSEAEPLCGDQGGRTLLQGVWGKKPQPLNFFQIATYFASFKTP